MKRIVVCLIALMLALVASAQGKGNRIGIAFMAGVDGLGSSPASGIRTMNNAYGTRLWFNSWQVELNYKLKITRKTYFHFGVGYESDVFKMDNNIVEMLRYKDGTGELVILDETACVNPYDFYDYETRLVTRYINIPVGIQIGLGDLRLGVTLVAGFNYTSRNTGLKYSYRGITENDKTDNISQFINPYKIDVRFELLYDCVGIYCQLATRPLFQNADFNRIYPFKAGAMLRF